MGERIDLINRTIDFNIQYDRNKHMEQLKLLFVLNISLDQPGPSVHLMSDIIKKCAELNFALTVISKASSKQKINSTYQGNIEIVEIPCKYERKSLPKRYLIDIKYAKQCERFYRNRDFDVVFLQSCNTAFFHIRLLKKTLHARILYNVQDIFPYNAKYTKQLPLAPISFRALNFLQTWAYKKSDKIVTISEDMAELLYTNGIGKTPVRVIHNWGYENTCRLISDDENEFIINNNIPTDQFKVVYAGNIGTVQNVEIIIDAAKQLHYRDDIHFYIIGDGNQKDTLLKRVERERLNNVTFFDSQPEMIAPFVYAMGDANIIPLKKGIIYTALPSKVAACLTYGKVIIGCIEKDTELGCLLSKTDGCHVVSNADGQELADKLVDLADAPRSQVSYNREKAMALFGKDRNVNQYIKELVALK